MFVPCEGSILGPLAFVLYINDLPNIVNASMFLFADDTKIFDKITSVNDQVSLQHDIDNMAKWAETWLLKYHPLKCKTMRIGDDTIENYNYTLNNHILERTDIEKDLGVLIDRKLSFDDHIQAKINTANKIMGLIRRTFTFLDADNFKKLFKAMVRPHLEFSNAVWHPRTKKMKDQLENIQRRGSKRINNMGDLTYEERLKKLKLPCLCYRKIRGDVIEAYKMTHNYYDNNLPMPISLAPDTYRNTRGKFKMIKTHNKKRVTRLFFKNRVINFWNKLPDDVKDAPTINSFKNRLDTHWEKFDIKYNYNNCIDFERSIANPSHPGSTVNN